MIKEGPPYWSNLMFKEEWFNMCPTVKVYKMHLLPGQGKGTGLTEDKAYHVLRCKYKGMPSEGSNSFTIYITDDTGRPHEFDPGYFKFADERVNHLISVLFL